ncbi:MAG: hypothetical protein EPN86_01060 [Nanoarchaeota archaeon]|nr:MAG: hypothetical protein EPN86_01060 [Nanoarchaeota archaeon]
MVYDGQIEAKLEIGAFFAERYLGMYRQNLSRRTSDDPQYSAVADHLFAHEVKFDLGMFSEFTDRDRGLLGMLDFELSEEVGVNIDTIEMLKQSSNNLLKILEERGLKGFLQYLEGLV